jgi:hypothetical protein
VQGLPFKRPTPCLCFTTAHSARSLLHACFCSPGSCHLLPVLPTLPALPALPALLQHFHIGSAHSAFGQSHCHTSSSQPSEDTPGADADSRRLLPTVSFFASSARLAHHSTAQPGSLYIIRSPGPATTLIPPIRTSPCPLPRPASCTRPTRQHTNTPPHQRVSCCPQSLPLWPLIPASDHLDHHLAHLAHTTSSTPLPVSSTSSSPPPATLPTSSTLAPPLSLDKSTSWPTTRRRQSRPWATGLSNRPLRCSSKAAWVGWTMTVARDRTLQVTQASKARSSRRKAHIQW